MAANATELFLEMFSAIGQRNWLRKSEDLTSPTNGDTVEATPGQNFTLRSTAHNVVGCKSIDLRWAIANVLHFFADTERADVLSRYNSHAAKFVSKEGWWQGAYGRIAMKQIRGCIHKLRVSPQSRRAIVSMGGFEPQETINSPACWSFLHFLNGAYGLDLCVYQRSLLLFGVMPYDCVLLTNILEYVAAKAQLRAGELHWSVGSLHRKPEEAENRLFDRARNEGLHLPVELLEDPGRCYEMLQRPELLPQPFRSIMEQPTEVRT